MTTATHRLLVWLLLALLPGMALAQQTGHVDLEQRLTPQQLQEVGLTPTQLQLLNRYLREDDARRGAQAPSGPPVETARYEDADGKRKQDESSLVGFSDKPIKSRARGTINGWAPGTVFELENGQSWKVLKGEMELRKPKDAPEVEVIPGIAGRWFLQVDPDMPKARVYRID